MEATEGLKAQHRQAEQLFSEIEQAQSPDAKRQLMQELADKLTLHMDLEENLFYPAVEEVDEGKVKHSYEEHNEVKPILARLLTLEGDEPEFAQLLQKAKESIEHHVREEEEELFPKCFEVLGADGLEDLGEEMEEWIKTSIATASKEGSTQSPEIAP